MFIPKSVKVHRKWLTSESEIACLLIHRMCLAEVKLQALELLDSQMPSIAGRPYLNIFFDIRNCLSRLLWQKTLAQPSATAPLRADTILQLYARAMLSPVSS